MVNDPIELRVSTASLRKLLDGNPEVRLKLDAMACEKIAEELKRKVDAGLADLEQQATRIVNAAFQKADTAMQASIRSKWEFPEATKVIIRDVAKGAVDEVMAQTIRACKVMLDNRGSDIDKLLAAKFAAAEARYVDRLPALIRNAARAEFMSVIAEVKSATKES
jgi:hypothetical protein